MCIRDSINLGEEWLTDLLVEPEVSNDIQKWPFKPDSTGYTTVSYTHLMPRHNVFTVLVSQLWQTDTPTNLFPSIHVYNSLGAHFAVMNNETLSGKKWVRRGSLILCVSIILSTMFIKQHSMFDVLMAFIMGAVMYAAVYYYDVVAAYRFQTGKRQRKRARIG